MVPSGWQVMVWVLFMELPDSAAGSVHTKVRDSPTAMEINPESGSGLYPLSDWGTAHLKLAHYQVSLANHNVINVACFYLVVQGGQPVANCPVALSHLTSCDLLAVVPA